MTTVLRRGDIVRLGLRMRAIVLSVSPSGRAKLRRINDLGVAYGEVEDIDARQDRALDEGVTVVNMTTETAPWAETAPKAEPKPTSGQWNQRHPRRKAIT